MLLYGPAVRTMSTTRDIKTQAPWPCSSCDGALKRLRSTRASHPPRHLGIARAALTTAASGGVEVACTQLHQQGVI